MIEIIYGIECHTPAPPPSKEIDGYGAPKNNQLFNRIEIPESFYEIEHDEDDLPMYDEQQIVFIRREWDRIKNMGKDKPLWYQSLN